jgi:hypothetical protein
LVLEVLVRQTLRWRLFRVLIQFLAVLLLLAAVLAEEAVLRVQRPAALAGLAVALDGLLVVQVLLDKVTTERHLQAVTLELCIGVVAEAVLDQLELLKIQLHLAIQEEQGRFHQ